MATGVDRIVVRRPRHGEGRRMAALYRAAFADRHPGRSLWPRFEMDESLVATIDGEIVGVACFEPARRDLDALLGCLEPTTRRFLEPLGHEPLPDEPPAVVVEAPPGVAPVRRRGDRVFSALAVDRSVRRHGVGWALAVRRLQLAANAGVPQVFVHAVAGSGSRQLYERLGFTPLVRLAAHYRDGTGMTLLYRELGARSG